ncbi:LGFP repeat-containing protein [Cystobacter fuscus]
MGRYNHFERGSIYWTPATGARVVMGSIRVKWEQLGWERSVLGYPITDEMTTPDMVGRYNHFEQGSIYWTPETGAHEVHHLIREKWAALGWEKSPLGYPTTDEMTTPDTVGRYNHFQNGSIYWTPTTGAHEVRGLIRDKWSSLGWEKSPVGYPVSDEYAVTGGRESEFQKGFLTGPPPPTPSPCA